MALSLSGTLGVSQDAVGSAPVKSYSSSNLSIPTTNNQITTVNHGLGVTPRLVRVVAVCLTAVNGWAIGDEGEVLFNCVDNGTYQVMWWANSTQVGFSSGSGVMIINRTNGYTFNILNNSSFALKVYAFA